MSFQKKHPVQILVSVNDAVLEYQRVSVDSRLLRVFSSLLANPDPDNIQDYLDFYQVRFRYGHPYVMRMREFYDGDYLE